ncbi:MAG: ABC transporter permease, partial [Bryobacteraceae bacterium]
MLADIRYALRNLFRSPVFTAVALGSLALGIGANTAIFSLTDQLLLRALPVQRPEQLVLLSANGPNPGSSNVNYTADVAFSYPVFRDFRDRAPVFNGVLARYPLSLTMSWNGHTERISGELVSGDYFDVLGVHAAIGRTFTRDDNRTPGAHPVAILSYGFWQRRFASDPAILNQTIDINAHPMTIVGITRPGFRSVAVGEAPDVFVPMMMKSEMTAGWNDLDDRRSSWLTIFARLKPGISLQRAEAGMAPLWHSILEKEVKAMNSHNARFRSTFLARHLSLLPGARGVSGIRGQVREPL